MKRLSIAGLALALAGFAAAGKAADENAAKLVGTWVITKSDGKGEGTVVEFTKDGKLNLRVKTETAEVPVAGTYKVDKDKLSVDLKVKDKSGNEQAHKEELTIRKLTDDSLEIEDQAKKVDVLKKKK